MPQQQHLSATSAEEQGFATYNKNGVHVCIDLPQSNATISVKTPDGELVTFAFIPRPEGEGHQCVDIQHHGKVVNESNCPLQSASFLGQGPTNAVTRPQDDSPTTVVVLRIPTAKQQIKLKPKPKQ